MNDRLISYEVGAFRISKSGELDAGRDGLRWIAADRTSSRPAVAAVSDGIGFEGEGQKALDGFEKLFLELKCLRSSVLQLLRSKHCATFVGIQFPETFHDMARVISLGDSSALQVRRQRHSEDQVKTLTTPNNLRGILKKICPELDEWQATMVRGELLPSNLLEVLFEQIEPYVRDSVSCRPHLHVLLEQYSSEHDPQQKQDFVFRMLCDISDIIILDLGSSRREVEREVGAGTFFPLEPNDDVVLFTDGMDLSPRDVAKVLKKHHPAQAAKKLVQMSQKQDDRAVVVVRAKDTDTRAPKRRLVRASIRSRR